MASTPTGVVSQANLTGSELLYTDTGNYGTVSSRILTIYDYKNNLFATYNMGASLTQLVPIPNDAWYMFVCTVTDNVSGSPWVTTRYYTAYGYYSAAYLAQYTANLCGCLGDNCNLTYGENSLQAAFRYTLSGITGASSAQSAIVAANYFVNLSPNVQLA